MALIHTNFFSDALGMCVNCDVILPQKSSKLIGMDTGVRSDGKHPVLWLLHGASDDNTIWQRRTSIERYAAPLGLAVVMPSAHLSSYSDMVHGGTFFTYIADELPQKMRSFFPLSDKREDNFIAGLSMGGSGCVKIGLARPENYAAIGCLSAGMSTVKNKVTRSNNPLWQKRMYATYGNRDLVGTEEDTPASVHRILAEKLPAPMIYHACGDEDFLLESAHEMRDFFQAIPGNPFNYTYEENPGAHTWEFWDEHIQHFLKLLNLEPKKDIRN